MLRVQCPNVADIIDLFYFTIVWKWTDRQYPLKIRTRTTPNRQPKEDLNDIIWIIIILLYVNTCIPTCGSRTARKAPTRASMISSHAFLSISVGTRNTSTVA